MCRSLRLANVASSLAMACLLSGGVHATSAEDLADLQIACRDAAKVINGSLNSSAPLNTSTLVQNIGYQVGASQINLATSNTSMMAKPTPINGYATYPLDAQYFDYGGSLNTLAQALLRRGQAAHDEPDAPVFLAIQGLGAAIEEYALQLRDQSLVSEEAFIFALAVENDLIQAESAWAGFTSPEAFASNRTTDYHRKKKRTTTTTMTR